MMGRLYIGVLVGVAYSGLAVRQPRTYICTVALSIYRHAAINEKIIVNANPYKTKVEISTSHGTVGVAILR